MKVLLIGHNRGIGKAIYEDLSKKFEVDGKSISNGFDINEPHPEFNYDKYDIVILNAYDKFCSQIKTLFEIVEKLSKQKLLIVLSSTSAYKSNHTDLYWAKYSVEKNGIIKAGRDLNTMGYNISVISPGTVNTHRNIHKNCKKLSIYDISKTVLNVIEFYKKGILLEHIVIRPVKD